MAGVVEPIGDGLGVPGIWVHGRVQPIGSPGPLDDHNAPAVAGLGGSRLLAGFTGHLDTPLVTLLEMDLEQDGLSIRQGLVVKFEAPCTYVNLFPQSDGTVTVVTRSHAMNPTIMRVDMRTGSTSTPRVLVPWRNPRHSPGHSAHYSGRDGGRPYAVFSQEGDRIHFALTPDHPRAYRNGVYCGFLDGDAIKDARGREVARIGDADWDPTVSLTEATPSGRPQVAWVQDLAVIDGVPRVGISLIEKSDAAFHAQRDADATGLTVEYRVATVGPEGVEHQFAGFGGTPLLAHESDYARGLSLSRTDPAVFAIATNAHPSSGQPRRASQVFAGTIAGDGRVHFQLVSEPGGAPALRPVFSTPLDDEGHALLWLEGRYPSFKEYSLAVRSVTFEPGRNCMQRPRHVDASIGLGQGIHMGELERAALEERLRHARRYLEYGSGASTLAAVSAGIPEIVSVESDLAFLRLLEALARPSLRQGQELDLLWADVGPTGAWGIPIGPADGSAYVQAPGGRIVSGWMPDTVLIDGRYRTACLLYLASVATESMTVLWDDYATRPEYHWVEQVLQPDEIIGRLAVFILEPTSIDPALIARALTEVR